MFQGLSRGPSPKLWLVLAAVLTVATGCADSTRPDDRTAPTSTAPTSTAPVSSEVVYAVGDIGYCKGRGDEQVAELIGDRGTFLALGDLAYDRGSKAEFDNCYAPAWGAFKSRTRPAPGNHEYGTAGASGYFDYFGPGVGTAGQGWYSFDIGSWHVVALNSNCELVGCAPGGAQEQWLRSDLTASEAPCSLAFWHHPRFSSGALHGSDPKVAPLWQAFADLGGDLVLNGHEHNYERFAPLDGRGEPDAARGVREIVVGTGGRSLYRFGPAVVGSEFRKSDSYGVLRLELRPDSYSWEFLTVPGSEVADAGTTPCH